MQFFRGTYFAFPSTFPIDKRSHFGVNYYCLKSHFGAIKIISPDLFLWNYRHTYRQARYPLLYKTKCLVVNIPYALLPASCKYSCLCVVVNATFEQISHQHTCRKISKIASSFLCYRYFTFFTSSCKVKKLKFDNIYVRRFSHITFYIYGCLTY